MTTANSVDMLKDIIRVYGHPKMIVSDSGPLFCNNYVAQLWAFMVDHSYNEAYMPSRNPRAMHAVALVKQLTNMKNKVLINIIYFI